MTISPQDLDRTLAVDHSDPHTVLGPHVTDRGLVIRAFRPDALEINVIPDQESPRAMQRVRGDLFEAYFPDRNAPFAYRLEVRYAAGVFNLRDPYAFPPSLGELDLHLAAEGKHE